MDKTISSSKPNEGCRSEGFHLHAVGHPSGIGRLYHKALKNNVYLYVNAKCPFVLKLPQQMYIVSLNISFHLPLSCCNTSTLSVIYVVIHLLCTIWKQQKKIHIPYHSLIKVWCLVLFRRNSTDLSGLGFISLKKMQNKKTKKALCILPKNHYGLLSQFHALKHVGISLKYYHTKSLYCVGPPCNILTLLLISTFLEEFSPRPRRASCGILLFITNLKLFLF